jgi:hypothetical protein
MMPLDTVGRDRYPTAFWKWKENNLIIIFVLLEELSLEHR